MKVRLLVLACICGFAAAASGVLAREQGQATGPDHVAASRALARFGYGVSATNAGGESDTKLAEELLARAQRAARLPANVPSELSGFTLPLPEQFRTVREDDLRRRQSTAATKSPSLRSQWSKDAANWRLMACSDPALEEPMLARMTEFWFNHFNITTRKGLIGPLGGHYVVSVIRPHALGKFEDLLISVAHHPAMLIYLDQARNVAGTGPGRGINENYARELMELHTLGVTGGYSQQDVRELARILTGLRLDGRTVLGSSFNEAEHDRGAKLFLGRTFPAGRAGTVEVDEALRLLAHHPSTARRVALRLAQWFVADDPPPALVNRLAQTFTNTSGDIAALMRTLIEAPETWDGTARLYKTPFDFACSTLGNLGESKDPRALALSRSFLVRSGQPIHEWLTPDGYKTDIGSWLSPESTTDRVEYALQMARFTGAKPNGVPNSVVFTPQFMYK